MNCQQIDKYIYEFCDKQLSPKLHDRIQSHLDQCEYCRNKIESARREGVVLRSLPVLPILQPHFTSDVMTSVRGFGDSGRAGLLRGRRGYHPRKLVWGWGVACAAVVILVISALSLSEMPLGTKIADQTDDVIMQADVVPSPASVVPADSVSATDPATGRAEIEQSPQTRQDSYQNKAKEDAPPTPAVHHFSTAAVNDKAMKTALMVEPNRGIDLLTLYPANLPPDYMLQSIISPSDEEIIFVYENQATYQELTLTLVNVPPAADQWAHPGQDPVLLRSTAVYRAASELTAPPRAQNEVSNSVQRVLDHDQHAYQVLLSAEISTEELTGIADAMTLEEGSHRVQMENP